MPLVSAVRADEKRPTATRPTVSSVSRAASDTGTRPLNQLNPMPATSTRATSARVTLLRRVNSSGAEHAQSSGSTMKTASP